MKRTISEVVELIKQKKESAEQEISKLNTTLMNDDIYDSLVGNIQAYTDVLSLLESSHLIEKEQVLEILKNKFVITLLFYPNEEVDNFIRFIGKTDYEKTGYEKRAVEKITNEEFAILKEAFENE